MPWIARLAVIKLMAFLNTMRGANIRGIPRLPFRGLNRLAAFGVGATAWWVAGDWQVGAAFGVAYMLWSLPGWGRWFSLGRHPVERDSLTIRIVEWLARPLPTFGAWTWYHNALLVRMSLATPMLIAIGWWFDSPWLIVAAIPAPFLIVGAYEIGFRYGVEEHSLRHPIPLSEMMTGAIWAGLTLLL